MKLVLPSRKIIILGLALVAIFTYLYYQRSISTTNQPISSFEECAEAGYPIMESYPERCSVPGGATFTRQIPGEEITSITITGAYTCLPKVNTGGPVTLECALGLVTDQGAYALDMNDVAGGSYPELVGNEEITVEGTLTPKSMLSSAHWQTYDIVGVISLTKLTVK